jgi:hypothetical protein
MVDFETLNKEEQVNKVGPPVEAPLLEAPPQESSSFRANRGKHGQEMASLQQQQQQKKNQN